MLRAEPELVPEPEPAARTAPVQTMPFIEYPPQYETLNERFSRVKQLRAAGKRAEAIALLEETTLLHPDSERAWLILSKLYPDPLAKIRALEHALEISPQAAETARKLEVLRPMEKDPLKRGSYFQEQGEQDLAIELYRSVIALSHLPAERLEAERRIENIRLRQEADGLRKISPTVTLLRLASGPVLLFTMMVFMQSGLNPLHTPLLALPGFVSVLAGSLVVSACSMQPAHPRWLKLLGVKSTTEEPEIHNGARMLGWALLIAPYTMFFIEASHRLGILQSSMFAR
jgi:tetratricopeptide (TPR) repeat protein